jgi:hypothetical protein
MFGGVDKKGVKNARDKKAASDQARVATGEVITNDPTKFGSASWHIGELTRQEWDDYEKRFQPYDQKLINIATGKEDNEAAIANARGLASASFDVANGINYRNRSRLGLSTAADEMKSSMRLRDTNKTLAELSAVNNTRMAGEDRDMILLLVCAIVDYRGLNYELRIGWCRTPN